MTFCSYFSTVYVSLEFLNLKPLPKDNTEIKMQARQTERNTGPQNQGWHTPNWCVYVPPGMAAGWVSTSRWLDAHLRRGWLPMNNGENQRYAWKVRHAYCSANLLCSGIHDFPVFPHTLMLSSTLPKDVFKSL